MLQQGEIRRILDLDRRVYGHPEGISWTEVLRKRPDAPHLFPDQEIFLSACADAADTWFGPVQGGPGVAGFLACGAGKTLALLLAPLFFGVKPRNALYLTEANLIRQMERDARQWSKFYPVQEPKTLSYGKLSHPQYKKELWKRKPDMILADEFHRIGKRARYTRLFEYLQEHPHVRLIGVSGSMMKSSLSQLQRMLSLILRSWSPIPYNSNADNWASVLDIGGEYSRFDLDAIWPLVKWAEKHGATLDGSDRRMARQAFQERLKTCPGVVVTSGSFNVHATLTVRMLHPEMTPQLRQLEERWELPDGTELVDTLEIYRHRREVRLGYFSRWDPETVTEEWVTTRRRWAQIVNAYVEYGSFQTRFFVEQAARQGVLRHDAIEAWRAWRAASAAYEPPITEVIWFRPDILRGLLDVHVRQAPDPERVSIWYHNRAVADFIEAERDIRVIRAKESKPRFGPAAVPLAFSTGWSRTEGSTNFHEALVLQPPTGADAIEQLLARHHRAGQQRDVTYKLVGTEVDLAKLRQKAEALKNMSGAPQRILVADCPELVTR